MTATASPGTPAPGAPASTAIPDDEIPRAPGERWHKARRRLVGVAFLMVAVLLVWTSIAAYDKKFSPVADVTLYTDQTGAEMHLGADVMARGVIVGSVRNITSTGGRARLQLAIQPGAVSQLPANVTAEMLPTTLFGQRYVDLVLPPNPAPQRLTGGTVISQDRSRDAIELEKVLNDLLPFLSAVQPQKLSATLTAISQALNGRGGELGQTLRTINSYWQRFNPQLPAFDDDIRKLVNLAQTYSQAGPKIIQALNDFTTTSRTFAAEQNTLNTVYSTVSGMANNFTTFLQNNSGNIIHLSADSVGTLRILNRYSTEFPCVLQDVVKLEPAIDKTLGRGTGQPGIHGRAFVVPVYANARYRAPRDNPVYRRNTGPHCYPTPFTGVAINADPGALSLAAADSRTAGGGAPASRTGQAASPSGLGGLGLANSPSENELINELLSPQLNTAPAALPSWSSVLVGPVYRGAEVKLK